MRLFKLLRAYAHVQELPPWLQWLAPMPPGVVEITMSVFGLTLEQLNTLNRSIAVIEFDIHHPVTTAILMATELHTNTLSERKQL